MRGSNSFFSVFWNAPGSVGLSGEVMTVGWSEINAGGSVGLRNGGSPFSAGFYSQLSVEMTYERV
jgi:hypothetical protein